MASLTSYDYILHPCMYIYVHVCMYMYVCSMYVCMYVCIHVHVCMYMYVCTCMYVHVYVHVCLYVCMYICMQCVTDDNYISSLDN